MGLSLASEASKLEFLILTPFRLQSDFPLHLVRVQGPRDHTLNSPLCLLVSKQGQLGQRKVMNIQSKNPFFFLFLLAHIKHVRVSL